MKKREREQPVKALQRVLKDEEEQKKSVRQGCLATVLVLSLDAFRSSLVLQLSCRHGSFLCPNKSLFLLRCLFR